MKKIIICSWAMEIGGVERSLIGLLNAIDYNQYSVDLFLCRHEGEFMNMIPSNVDLLPEIKEYTMFQKSIKKVFKEGGYKIAIKRLKCKSILKKKGMGEDSLLGYYSQESLNLVPKISNEQYDLAISFLTPHFFVSEKVNANKKIAWIHTDYTAIDVDGPFELKMWEKYDYIASISEKCTETFMKIFPSLKGKIVEIENILSADFVRNQAEMDESIEVDGSPDVIKLCTVGRFCEAKAYDNAIKICRKLLDRGLNIKWYVIGYGGDESMMRKLIEEYHVENEFIILGKKNNPYPYMKACDYYMQLSRYEGKSVAVTEAKMLRKSVVITDFPTAVNHLQDGVDGFIVPIEINACANEIEKILNDKEKVKEVVGYLEQHDYSNVEEVEKIYSLMDEENGN